MKKFLLSLLLAGLLIPAISQSSNLIIFSENAERFQVVLNSVLQNADAETNVMIQDLIAPSYKVKIIFEDEISDLDKTIYFSNGSAQDTYMIKKNRKDVYVIRVQNSVPIAQAPPPPATQRVYVYSATPPVAAVSVTSTQTTTTTNVSAPATGTNVNVNANMNGMNVNMSINESNSSTQTSTTTSTGITTGGSGTYTETVYVLPGYDGYYGCPYPMAENDFRMAKQSIESKDFSDSKVTLAKQVLNSNCMLTSQVHELVGLFDFEDDKLDIAKYAYGSTLDVGNYYRVNDAFEFESTIEELDEYIRNYRR